MVSTAEHLSLGRLGEDLACRFLEGKGFIIKDRNYRETWGELDIVAEYAGVTRFIEVKSVSRNAHEDAGRDTHRPEDNIHDKKVARLKRIIQSYRQAKKVGEWQFDFITVKIDTNEKKARLAFEENIIL